MFLGDTNNWKPVTLVLWLCLTLKLVKVSYTSGVGIKMIICQILNIVMGVHISITLISLKAHRYLLSSVLRHFSSCLCYECLRHRCCHIDEEFFLIC